MVSPGYRSGRTNNSVDNLASPAPPAPGPSRERWTTVFHWISLLGLGLLAVLLLMRAETWCDRAGLMAKGESAEEQLMYAARHADGPAAERALRHGANCNHATPGGLTPLMLAVGGVANEPAKAVAVVQLLLEHGARVDQSDVNGRTALSYAAAVGNRAVAQCLLQAGADPTRPDTLGRTPADHARAAGCCDLADTLDEAASRPVPERPREVQRRRTTGMQVTSKSDAISPEYYLFTFSFYLSLADSTLGAVSCGEGWRHYPTG